MSSLAIASAAFGCLVGGALAGSSIRARLPEVHLKDDSRDVLKLASGVIATLVALVIGLLVGSSKSAYDQADAGVTRIGAEVILLDRALRRYGPEAGPIRALLGRNFVAAAERLWPTSAGARPDLAAVERGTGFEDAQEMIARLEPADEAHRFLRTHALELSGDLVRSRWLMLEQAQSAPPPAFLAMLVFWLTVLFASLGLLAPRNPTTAGSLLVCALAMASAIFLILEMSRPMEGSIRVSAAPIRKAIAVIGRPG